MKLNRFYILFSVLYLLYLIFWWNALPNPLFEVSYSTLLLDRKEGIMGVKVAQDEQFRFPGTNVLPDKYKEALFAFEDKRFWQHKGVDWFALARAMYRNIKAGRVVSGGSTISMQVIRLARKNPPRTYREKFWEIFLTLRLEQSYSKEQILQLYAAHAPFGKNIVGLQAAALKYFDRDPGQLSWAEAAFLAVLPNAPALNNVRLLKEKRNRLLKELYRLGKIEEEDYRLALEEPMPEMYIIRKILLLIY